MSSCAADSLADALAEAARRGATGRVCEVSSANGSLALAEAVLCRLTASRVRNFTAVRYPWHDLRRSSGMAHWQPPRDPRIRALAGTKAHTVRGRIGKQLGECDVILLGADAPNGTARASLVYDLPALLQHAAPRSVFALHGSRCEAAPPEDRRYNAPFWINNLPVPCWLDTWAELTERRSVSVFEQARCRAVPSARGERTVCVGDFRARTSACGSQVPLLEAWARGGSGDGGGVGERSGGTEAAAEAAAAAAAAVAAAAAGAAGGCGVRKQAVSMVASSKIWTVATAARSTLAHQYRHHLRYFSALPCADDAAGSPSAAAGQSAPDEAVCLLFKDEVAELWVAGLPSRDGLRFVGDPALVLPKISLNGGWQGGQLSAMTHNLAVASAGREWLAVGGKHSKGADVLYQSPSSTMKSAAKRAGEGKRAAAIEERQFRRRVGLWMIRGPSWRFDAAGRPETGEVSRWLDHKSMVVEPRATHWREKRLIFDGRHAGCVERRPAGNASRFPYLYPGVCEFDGRLSLVANYMGRQWLYTRANAASHGARHVQVTSSADGGVTWSPFQMVDIAGYDVGEGEIYFFAAQVNPSHDGSLVAIFPLVHRLRGCIAIASSVDGVHWSAITPLLGCGLYGERTLDQPTVPSMVRRGGEVWLYIHEDVPRITIDANMPITMYHSLEATEESGKLVRYAFGCELLAGWTRRSLGTIAHGGGSASAGDSFRSSCPPGAPPPQTYPQAACDWRPRAQPFSSNARAGKGGGKGAKAKSSKSKSSGRGRGRGARKRAPRSVR